MVGPTVLSVERLLGLASGATAEQIQDAVAAALAGVGALSVTYDDVQNLISLRNLWSTSGSPVDMPALGDVYSQAQTLPLADLLNKLDPAHASYSLPWAVLYQLLVGAGALPDRRAVIRLAPVGPTGSATSVSWQAQGGLPAGTFSAPATYSNNSPTYGVGKALDGSSATYTYPSTALKIGWWLQFDLAQAVQWKRLELLLSTGNYRPTSARLSLGDSAATLVDVGDYALDITPSSATTALHSLVLPTRAPCRTCRITFLTMFDSALAGYSVLEVNPYGVV